MDYNPSHESLGKPLKKIIIEMLKIGFTTSPDITTITPEKIGATIEQMFHEFPTICSLVSNGLFISIFRTNSFLLQGKSHVYHKNTYVKDQLMRLPRYNQNTRFWKCLI